MVIQLDTSTATALTGASSTASAYVVIAKFREIVDETMDVASARFARKDAAMATERSRLEVPKFMPILRRAPLHAVCRATSPTEDEQGFHEDRRLGR